MGKALVGLIVGLVAGVLIAKGVFLDPVEDLAFRMFMANDAQFQPDQVMNSMTFRKLLTGAIFGAGIGFLGPAIAWMVRDSHPEDH